MFIFFFIFLIVHFIATAGYSNLFPSTTEKQVLRFILITAAGIFITFITFPNIMENLIIGVIIYELIGLILISIGVSKYLKDEKKEQENW